MRSALHTVTIAVVFVASTFAQEPAAPRSQQTLTNADVVGMVKSGLAESTIIGAMQVNSANFDVSPMALVELNKAGVSTKIMDAMLTVTANNMSGKTQGSQAKTSARAAGAADAGASTTVLSVAVVEGKMRRALPTERTQLTEVAAKARSLGELSRDRAVDSAVRTGMAEGIRTLGGSAAGNAAGSIAGGVASGLFSGTGRARSVTFLWAVPKIGADEILINDMPFFEVASGSTIGVRPEEYTPVIVKLTPTSNARLVGATEGKENTGSRSVADWPIYTEFIEDRVPVTVRSAAIGIWTITPIAPLASGEYGVVLRPRLKTKKFAGQDVARNQGDGLIFNAVWSFAVR